MFKDPLLKQVYNKYMTASLLGMTASFGKIILLSILVGNILGSGALAVTGIGRPFTFVYLMLGNLIAVGGSTVCSHFMGNGQEDKAKEIFTTSYLLVVVFSVLTSVIFLIFMRPFLNTVCAGDAALVDEAMPYCVITVIGGIGLGFINPVFYYIRLAGKTHAIVLLNLLDAAVCIGLFFVLQAFHVGVAGAAAANVGGSLTMAAAASIIFMNKGNGIHFTRVPLKTLFSQAGTICFQGLPGGIENGSNFLRSSMIINMLAFAFGNAAVSIFSMVTSLNDILNIILIGMAGAVLPFIGVFIAEHDIDGTKTVMKQALLKGGIAALICTAAGCIFSVQIAGIFGMKAQAAEAAPAVMAFSLSFLPAVVNYLLIMLHMNNGHFIVANILMVGRTFAYLILAFSLLSRKGTEGLVWYSFLIAEILTLVTALAFHVFYALRNRNLSFWTLLDESEERNGGLLTISMKSNPEEIASACDKVTGYAHANGIDGRRSMYIRLAAEEILQSVMLHAYEGRRDGVVDVCMFMDGKDAVMRFRYVGKIFNPIEYAAAHKEKKDLEDEDDFIAVGVIAVLDSASDDQYMRTLGINNLIITLKPQTVTDFMCEKHLAELDPELHKKYCESVPIIRKALTTYESQFVNWPDHSYIHSLGVIEQCNLLIGDQIGKMNAQEIYVLLMGAFLHDIGMGVSKDELEKYLKDIPPEFYAGLDPKTDSYRITRQCHQLLSQLVIMDKWRDFKIPSEAYARAISKVSNGHRKADLYDDKEYPADFEAEPGKKVALPYLAALVRYADELDIGPARNLCEYVEATMNARDIEERSKHAAIRGVEIHRSYVSITAQTDDPGIRSGVEEMTAEIQRKAEYCCDVTEKRTGFRIRQRKVRLHFI